MRQRGLVRQRSGASAVLAGLTSAAVWLVRRRRDRGSLAGETAVLTGGSRGLGRLIAEELARQGCRVVICARDRAELEETERSLAALEAEVLSVVCDVQDHRRLVVWPVQPAGRRRAPRNASGGITPTEIDSESSTHLTRCHQVEGMYSQSPGMRRLW